MGNLKLSRKLLDIRQRDSLPPVRNPSLQLSEKRCKRFEKALNSPKIATEKKMRLLWALKERALKGDQRSFAALIEWTYHPNRDVRDRAASLFPELYASDPKLAAALCSQAMSRHDPTFEEMLLRERADDIQVTMTLAGDDRIGQLYSMLDNKVLDRIELPRHWGFGRFRGNKIFDEDLAIAKRLKQLRKKRTTHPIIAMGALADGYDLRCTRAAHKVLEAAKITRKLRIPSLDLAFQFNRPISLGEIHAHQVMTTGPSIFCGAGQVDDPQFVKFIAKKARQKGQRMLIFTVANASGAPIGTLLLHKGKGALIGLDWTTEDYNEVCKLTIGKEEIRIGDANRSQRDVDRQIELEDHASMLENMLKARKVDMHFSVQSMKFPLPDSSDSYRQDMFGTWIADRLERRKQKLEDEEMVLSGIAMDCAEEFCALSEQDRWRENVRLRMKLMNDYIRVS